jgi:hypothetical protein
VARTSVGGTWRQFIGLAGALALGVVTAVPALAGTVTQVINCPSTDSLAANIADMTLAPVSFSETSQESPGTMTITAAEAGCAGKGWNVTVQTSDWSRQDGSSAIPANAFSLTQVTNPAPVSGQGIDAIGGPKLVSNVGTLNQPRKVLQADAGYGLGSYSQVLGVKLTVPATALPGTYRAVVTTTITTGP